jgi:hypothetical protein
MARCQAAPGSFFRVVRAVCDGFKQRRFSVGCDTSNFAATLIKPCLRHDDERWYGIHTFRRPFMNLIHKSLPIPPASHLLT